MSDLTKLGREDLNALAAQDGVHSPASLSNKQAVIDAILEARANDGRSATSDEAPAGERRPLERRASTGEWKCPFCGSPGGSNESRERRCGTPGCGAAIDGDEVVRAG